MSDSQVVSWADGEIAREDQPSCHLIELSLSGPRACLLKPSYEFPAARQLSYKERFGLRAERLDLSNTDDVKQFVRWVSLHCGGEDLSEPEVLFGYRLGERWRDFEHMEDAITYVRAELPALIAVLAPCMMALRVVDA